MHAASVGEVAAASPLVDALLVGREHVLLTALTPTGRAAAERFVSRGAVAAFPPLDLPIPVERALETVRPRALIIVETELWPTTVVRAAALGVRVAMANARLSESSARRYRSAVFPLASVRDSIDVVSCRSDEDRERFLSLGFDSRLVTVSGSLKFDALGESPGASELADLRGDLSIGDGVPVVVFGSVRPDEEAAILDAVEALLEDGATHAVVAPRHLDRVEPLANALAVRGLAHSLRTDGHEGRTEGARVTLLDTTGELERVYALADVAFVGGTLAPYGGHNPLEPASLGVPVVMGTHTESCAADADLLVQRGAACLVSTGEELVLELRRLMSDGAARKAMGDAALAAVASGAGATRRTLELFRSRGILDATRGEGA